MTYNVFGGTLSLTQSINQSFFSFFCGNPVLENKVDKFCKKNINT